MIVANAVRKPADVQGVGVVEVVTPVFDDDGFDATIDGREDAVPDGGTRETIVPRQRGVLRDAVTYALGIVAGGDAVAGVERKEVLVAMEHEHRRERARDDLLIRGRHRVVCGGARSRQAQRRDDSYHQSAGPYRKSPRDHSYSHAPDGIDGVVVPAIH